MYRRGWWKAYLFILPAFVVVIVFRLLPILQAVRMSFFRWGIAGPLDFVGLKNFARLFIDPKFYLSLSNTFWYVVLVVPLTIIVSLFFASMLNTKIQGRGVYRTLYYIPVVTSTVALSVVWKWIYNPDRGVLNALFNVLGLESVKWLNDPRGLFEVLLGAFGIEVSGFLAGPSVALLALIIMAIWHNAGYCIIIALAGLQNIPRQHYEAARLDGATGWNIFRHITLPALSPTLCYLLVTQSIIAFNTFTPVYVMTDPAGGPLGTTNLVVFYLYEQSFKLWNLGYANAIAFVIFILIFSLVFIQRKFIERRVYYA